ncbi:MAG: biotin--[acetyl-CoA-carboxylase] ligase [Pyrinomonadaceae bacterium]|nr:biotin--[acetyl-CoA-carboxylase] ligase [Pyrinomonadaceae bacterium]
MTGLFRPHILRFDSLPSTNTEAAWQARSGAPEGLIVVAREQTAGRGRQSRLWLSPKDAGLYCSAILRPRVGKEIWPLMTLMAATAVHDALRKACALPTDIKWPNDVLAGERKLCGILAEAIDTPTGACVVLGIGINLTDAAFPPQIKHTATSIEAETGKRYDAETMLRSLIAQLGENYSLLHEADGANRIIEAWSRASSYAEGKWVRVETGTKVFEGVTRGLAADGRLRVETTRGEIVTVSAGDVTQLRAAVSN